MYAWNTYFPESRSVDMIGYHNKIPQTDRLNNRNVFSYSSGDCKSKIEETAGLFSPEASSLGLQMAAFFLHPQGLFSVHARGREISGASSSSNKDTSLVRLGPHPYQLVPP